jgi:hypothetical protein
MFGIMMVDQIQRVPIQPIYKGTGKLSINLL